MNCANHPDIEKVAFCRTCGKPLCANCTRSVHGVIYCESCLAARLEGVQPNVQAPVAGFVPVSAVTTPGAGPNPALAGILAGFFPFGVGAVYTGQYAKGLAHLVIFTLLILGVSSGSGSAGLVFGLAIGGFYFYQIIDSVRSARAVQLGHAPPDPFGLATAFSGGERMDVSKVPVGAIVLIGLGVLFLLHTLDIWDFSARRIWPLVLIGIGGWLLLRRLGLLGEVPPGFDRVRSCRRGLMGPVILLTLGFQFLLDSMGVIRFGRTLPLLLVVIGLVKIFQSTAGPDPLAGSPPSSGVPPPGVVTGEVQPPYPEVKPEVKNG
ncbi:MAG: B-box zinc finger protein [Terriglobales bacterium]